ncbi:MAG: FAD-dependent oxidoreductase, partial [Deltaproteobacteria bacterium]|nr:FAD-dependent oxidoreductase [Deltaproteobacteria bacterium]
DFEVDADLVILATGFVGPGRNRLIDELEIALDKRGNVKSDERHMTSVEGLFVAGDMHQGQSLIVRAIADGRKAAYGIMKYLRGR